MSGEALLNPRSKPLLIREYVAGLERSLDLEQATVAELREQLALSNGQAGAGRQAKTKMPALQVIEPKAAWLRLFVWASRQASSAPNGAVIQFWRTRRLVIWLIMQPIRIADFVLVISGGRVSVERHGERMAVCEACPRRVLRIVGRTKPRVESYCGICGCPKWFMARLDRKNWWRRWYCPAKRHPGPYPEDAWRELVEAENARVVRQEHGAVADVQTAAAMGPNGRESGGCGCGST
jgi:hypothetical protein